MLHDPGGPCDTLLAYCCRTRPARCPASLACFPAAATTSNHCRWHPPTTATVSRLTLVTRGSDLVIQQIVSQLNKLIDVVRVEDMTGGEHLERELVLLKLRVDADGRDAVRGYVVRTGGRVLDPASESFIVELLGSEAEVTGFIATLARLGELIEVVRSGALGVSRDNRALRLVESA